MFDDESAQYVELLAGALDRAAYGPVRVHLLHAALAVAARREFLARLVERTEVAFEVGLARLEQALERRLDALGFIQHGSKEFRADGVVLGLGRSLS